MEIDASPNHDARPEDAAIDMLVLHYTGMRDGQMALERLKNPAAKVSAHYLIAENGTVIQLVDESRRAWHAGDAQWAGETDINGCSIGIELVHPGHEFGYRAFLPPQMKALINLAGDLVERYEIVPRRVLGHSDVAPDRKVDPGELFEWSRLAAVGIGLWPEVDFKADTEGPTFGVGDVGTEVEMLQSAFGRFGYGLEASGNYDLQTAAVVAAFQRHFRQRTVDGVADAETLSTLGHILARMA